MTRHEANGINAFWEMARHKQRDRVRRAVFNCGIIAIAAIVFGASLAWMLNK
jgi:hypothetical protein